jgi:hypothetical protein
MIICDTKLAFARLRRDLTGKDVDHSEDVGNTSRLSMGCLISVSDISELTITNSDEVRS